MTQFVSRMASTPTCTRPLRILIVDDNHINLSMLSRLLKRKFGSLVDGEPTTVDSALKAIQLLQQKIFDLVLMDIQMPFLNGLEATLRIRNAEDDILKANQTAHVVAVTTAVGQEPEAAYRRAGMDGMIGKPVRTQDIEPYLRSLSQEAFKFQDDAEKVFVNGVETFPPLPPTVMLLERAFYTPSDDTIRSPVDEICATSDFEVALHAQTLSSLEKLGLSAIAQAQVSDVDDSNARSDAVPESLRDTGSDESRPSTPSTPYDDYKIGRPRHLRGASLSMPMYGQQIARELWNNSQHDSIKSPRRSSRLQPLSPTSCDSRSPFWTTPSSSPALERSASETGNPFETSIASRPRPGSEPSESEALGTIPDVPALEVSSEIDLRRGSSFASDTSTEALTPADENDHQLMYKSVSGEEDQTPSEQSLSRLRFDPSRNASHSTIACIESDMSKCSISLDNHMRESCSKRSSRDSKLSSISRLDVSF